MDKAGVPYVFHPYHLAEQMSDEATTVTALLHDVVEDSDYACDDLSDMGFDAKIIAALKLLTHDKSVPYMDYIRTIKPNTVARAVKLADLAHNSDLSRLSPDIIDKKAIKRVKKYHQAIALLSSNDDFVPQVTKKE